MAAKYDITIDQGASWDLQFSIDLNTADYDITNCDFYGTVRQNEHYQEMTVEKINATSGIVRFTLTANQTDLLKSGVNYYDIEMHTNNAANQVYRLLNGKATVTKSQTTQRP